MMATIKFSCPACSHSLEAEPDTAGTSVACPECERIVRVPGGRAAGGNPKGSKTSALAVFSCGLGILSCNPVGPILGIPGIVCGHLALSRIKRSNGALTGRSMAVIGLISGYAFTLVYTIAWLVVS